MRTRNLSLRIGAPAVLIAVIAALWQFVATTRSSVLPPLQEIVIDAAGRPMFYLENWWVTVTTALIGGLLGVGIALVLAVLVVRFRFMRAAVIPVAMLLNVTPIVAIAPALVVAFGFNMIPNLIVTAISAFFPMLINALSGLESVDPQARDVFDAMAASRWEVFWRLQLPSSLSFLFAGARLAAAAAMLGAVISEFFGTSEGLGAVIVLATSYLNLGQMWAAIFLSALTSLALVGLIGMAERLVVRW